MVVYFNRLVFGVSKVVDQKNEKKKGDNMAYVGNILARYIKLTLWSFLTH